MSYDDESPQDVAREDSSYWDALYDRDADGTDDE
jgi:hypothetical protein